MDEARAAMPPEKLGHISLGQMFYAKRFIFQAGMNCSHKNG